MSNAAALRGQPCLLERVADEVIATPLQFISVRSVYAYARYRRSVAGLTPDGVNLPFHALSSTQKGHLDHD